MACRGSGVRVPSAPPNIGDLPGVRAGRLVSRPPSTANRGRNCQNQGMSALRTLGRVTGWTCIAIGGVQLVGGVRAEPGMTSDDPTVDSHVRFMGAVFAGYG